MSGLLKVMQPVAGKVVNSDFWLPAEYSASLLRAVSPLILTKCSPYLVVWTKRLCPSKKLICWSPNSQCFRIWRWGLCELIRIRRGHVGRALAWQNYRSYKKRASPMCMHQGEATWARSEMAVAYKPREDSEWNLPCWVPLSCTWQTSELWKMNFCH